jgi:two-component system sensor histidine kinase/response regulator
MADLLLDTTLDAGQRQYAQGIQVAGGALLAILNDILDFSKIEASMLELDNTSFSPLRCVEGKFRSIGAWR